MGGVDGENTEDEVARERNIRVKGFFCFVSFSVAYAIAGKREHLGTLRNNQENLYVIILQNS